MILGIYRLQRLENQGVMRENKVEAVIYGIINDLLGYVKRNENAVYRGKIVGAAHNTVVIPLLRELLGDTVGQQFIKFSDVHRVLLCEISLY